MPKHKHRMRETRLGRVETSCICMSFDSCLESENCIRVIESSYLYVTDCQRCYSPRPNECTPKVITRWTMDSWCPQRCITICHTHSGVCSAMNVLLTMRRPRLLGTLKSSLHKDGTSNHTVRSSASKRIPCHPRVSIMVRPWKLWKKIAQSPCKIQQGLPYP